MIAGQLKTVCEIDAEETFRARVDALGLAPQSELEDLGDQVKATRDFCRETRDRISTADVEVRWVERQGLKPAQYLAQLAEAPDEGVVLIRH